MIHRNIADFLTFLTIKIVLHILLSIFISNIRSEYYMIHNWSSALRLCLVAAQLWHIRRQQLTIGSSGCCCCCNWMLSWLLYLPWLLLWLRRLIRSRNCPHPELILDRTHSQRYTEPRLLRIILAPVIVGVKELLKPLQKLEIVLESALDQLVHRYYLDTCYNTMRIDLEQEFQFSINHLNN